MTITIPEWLLWMLAIPAGLVVLSLAILCFMLWYALGRPRD